VVWVPKFAVIGSGPTGLVVAHAIEMSGVPRDSIDIFSHGERSNLYGAQFLHGMIPGLLLDPFLINIETEGTMLQYREKVYETYRDFPLVPLEDFGGKHVGWDIRQTYNLLWEKYKSRIVPMSFEPGFAFTNAYDVLRKSYDHTFSTMPMRPFCLAPDHAWNTETVYAVGDAPGQQCPIRAPFNTVRYNGTDSSSWYRMANILDHCTVEWPAFGKHKKPPVTGVVRVSKPLSTNCSCWPELTRVGRYGEWKKGVLVNHAYERTMTTLAYGVQGVLF
jgi:hypothetical protein